MAFPNGASPGSPLLSCNKTAGNNAAGYNYNTVDLPSDIVGSRSASSSSDSLFAHDEHLTSPGEAFLNLLKGYFGAGMLSLPWALSQLEIYYGCLVIFIMCFWTSYNGWTVVKLKRYIELQESYHDDGGKQETASIKSGPGNLVETSSLASSVRTNLTFPDVGEWAYGSKFQSYVTACVCAQQLAICTVFISFIGENLLAVMNHMSMTGFVDSHIGVMTLCLPCVMGLSFLPSIKKLAPIMAVGTILLILTIGLIGVIMGKEWDDRPEELPPLDLPQIPLAACAILYSYEGICLVLPIESSMKEPKEFKYVFWGTMSVVAVILSTFAALNVIIFGDVTNGSVTAFLLEAYKKDPSVTWYLMAANTAVSFSVLLSYPLQLFPALELIGTTKFARWLGGMADVDDDEEDLAGFEPLPPLPEHDVADMEDEFPGEHQYGVEESGNGDEHEDDDDLKSQTSQSVLSTIADFLPRMVMPGDSPQLRAFLVLSTYTIAVVVPNVQALISLVGSLAGSSTALLIPPVLELAWIDTLEHHYQHKNDAVPMSISRSPRLMRPVEPKNEKTTPPVKKFGGRFLASKIKCYTLLLLGVVFAVIGTFASISDIVRIYGGGESS